MKSEDSTAKKRRRDESAVIEEQETNDASGNDHRTWEDGNRNLEAQETDGDL
jgi:hypothetical protein